MCAVRRTLETLFGFVYIMCLAELLQLETAQLLWSYSLILPAWVECSHFGSYGGTKAILLHFTIFLSPFKCQLKESTVKVLTVTITRATFNLF